MAAAEPKDEACKLCTRCDGRAPLSVEGAEAEEADALAAHVERLVQERDSGRRLSRSRLDPLEWEGILIWDMIVKAHERAHQARVAQLFEALLMTR
jgi:hypothetical protein